MISNSQLIPNNAQKSYISIVHSFTHSPKQIIHIIPSHLKSLTPCLVLIHSWEMISYPISLRKLKHLKENLPKSHPPVYYVLSRVCTYMFHLSSYCGGPNSLLLSSARHSTWVHSLLSISFSLSFPFSFSVSLFPTVLSTYKQTSFPHY